MRGTASALVALLAFAASAEPVDGFLPWFAAENLRSPTNVVPEASMPAEGVAAVEATLVFREPSAETADAPADAQAGARIVADGQGLFRFQFYGESAAGDCPRWHDANGEAPVPRPGATYTVRMEARYRRDARLRGPTLRFWVREGDSPFAPAFTGELAGSFGGLGTAERLHCVEFRGGGAVASLAAGCRADGATLTPGEPGAAYGSETEARAAIDGGELGVVPAPEVLAVLAEPGCAVSAADYCGFFAAVARRGEGDAWRVAPELTEAGRQALAESAAALTKGLDPAALARASSGGLEVAPTGGIPGFYYTLHAADELAALAEGAVVTRLCGPAGEVVFGPVTRPSAVRGFFTVSCSAVDSSPTGREK